MKKLQLLLLTMLLTHIPYVASSPYNNFRKRFFISTATLGVTGSGIHALKQYNVNTQYNKTQETFRALGIQYTNEVIVQDPSVAELTQKYYREISDVIHNEENTIIDRGICTAEKLKEVNDNFIKSQDHGLRKDLELTWINDEKQYGVVATTTIPAHTPIGRYTGVVRHTSEIENHDYAFDSLYIYKNNLNQLVIKEMQIDASQCGNITRFINAPCDDSQANCEAFNILDKNNTPQVVYAAARDIKPGQELTIGYGNKYEWKNKKS